MLRFERVGREPSLSEGAFELLVSATREALNNVRKHANATFVCVTLIFSSQELGLDISDNGIGTRNQTGTRDETAEAPRRTWSPAALVSRHSVKVLQNKTGSSSRNTAPARDSRYPFNSPLEHLDAMPAIRPFLVDDHPIVRSGLQAMLATASHFQLFGSAATSAEAIAAILCLVPEVALSDLRLASGSGFEIIAEVTRAGLSTQILVLTTYDDELSITRALDAGAKECLLKDVPREQLFAAIRLVAKGERVLSSQVQHRLSERSTPNPDTLSARELEVLHGVCRGDSNRTIAKCLFISEATVKTHLLHIFAKLGQSHRTAAVTEALRRGLIRLEGSD